LDHLVRAGQSYTAHHGDHYAAAITFFSVLSLVPLLMIAFAAAGFVLAGNPELLRHLQDQIQASAPAGLGPTLDQVIVGAINSRGGVGIVGLLGALYSGLGWMSNLREALTAQWRSTTQGERPPEPEGFLRRKVFDLLALLSLGLALVASFALTDPLPLAEALVAWANDQGGHDNITVTLARINPSRISPSTGGVA
jgi:membrane protein